MLDRLDNTIQQARHVPFSSQVMVDEDEIMDLVDQLRLHLPEEIKQANWTVQEQQRLIAEAHAEAARIMASANQRAEAAVRDQEVLRRAEREGQQTIREAQSRAEEIVREAEAYALKQLQQLEAHLGRTLATVRRGVDALQGSQPVPDAEPEQARA